jgi:hypothetical protein
MRRISLKVDVETAPKLENHYRYRVWLGQSDYARFVSRRTASHWARKASDELTFRYHEAGFIYRELSDLCRSVWMLSDTGTRISPALYISLDRQMKELAEQLDKVPGAGFTYDPVTKLIAWYANAKRPVQELSPIFRYRSDVERCYLVRSLGMRIEVSVASIEQLKNEKTGFSFQSEKKV